MSFSSKKIRQLHSQLTCYTQVHFTHNHNHSHSSLSSVSNTKIVEHEQQTRHGNALALCKHHHESSRVESRRMQAHRMQHSTDIQFIFFLLHHHDVNHKGIILKIQLLCTLESAQCALLLVRQLASQLAHMHTNNKRPSIFIYLYIFCRRCRRQCSPLNDQRNFYAIDFNLNF